MKKNQLLILFIILFVGIIIVEKTAVKQPNQYRELQIEAIERTVKSQAIIKEEKIKRGLIIEEDDINETGLIGSAEYQTEQTKLATTLGSLSAKRTSTNPQFSALVIKYFHYLGLKKGDKISLNFSSSFPGLMIAVMNAVEVMELEPIIMVSLGASIYGASNHNFTSIDMYHTLQEHGLFTHAINYWSFGGDDDIGREFDQDIKDVLKDKYLDIELIYEEDFKQNVLTRYQKYYQKGKPKAFVNVGGNIVSLGPSANINSNGIIKKEIVKLTENSGLIEYFLNDRVPVIHFLDINNLAVKEGLAVDPIPLPLIDEGDVFYSIAYNKVYLIIILSIAIIYLAINYIFIGRIYEKFKEKFIFRNRTNT